LTAATLKDPSFKDEREWRALAVHREVSQPLKFRAHGNRVLPYVELSLVAHQTPTEARLPIAEVLVGPGPDDELRARTARCMLRENGYDGVQVKISRVPFRD